MPRRPTRARRWDPEVDSAALRAMFDEGTADPNRTVGTEYMNQIYHNNPDKFGHIENVRNFHNAYRRVAAEWLTDNAMHGQRRAAANNNGQGNAAPPAADVDNEDEDDGTNVLVECQHAAT